MMMVTQTNKYFLHNSFCSIVYLQYGIDDCSQRTVIGEFGDVKYVHAPLAEVL